MVRALKLVIGLTGGIGSGKSTVAQMFAELGAEVIDTDEISHRLTAVNGQAMPLIAQVFGQDVVAADGSLDRAAMRQRIFADVSARKKLEDILHPLIREEVGRLLHQSKTTPYTIVVAPLLVETGAYQPLLQRVLVVDCPEPLQIQRAAARSHLDENTVRQIMAAQCSREQRLAAADDMILNENGLDKLRQEVLSTHKKYIALA